MMLLIVSWTELMKQALHCGLASMPTLNQTGELNAIFWWTIRWVSSALNVWRSASVLLLPEDRFTAVPLVIVAVYLATLPVLWKRWIALSAQ
jgi:hypothetical protein